MKKIEIFSKWDFQPIETFVVGEKNVKLVIETVEEGNPSVMIVFENGNTTNYVGFPYKVFSSMWKDGGKGIDDSIIHSKVLSDGKS